MANQPSERFMQEFFGFRAPRPEVIDWLFGDAPMPDLTTEELASDDRRDGEQQALKDKRRPEDYDRWPGRAGWVGNDR